ncbi:type 2 periplasmic-binding domain-containing protein [Marinobacterium jannaschii]|uniref:hypothetical protein n=1 Tax=Marinobacterium jannaschii TaxID=64970 RepID=UPI0012EB2229|nr:hypothetical protein [Marinobacterium jannaschii]
MTRAGFTLFILLSAFSYRAVAESMVITHPKVPLEAVSKQFLLSVFATQNKFWSNGLPIQVFVLPDEHPLHVEFAKGTLGVFPYQLRNIWDRVIDAGAGITPEQVVSPAEMMRRVQSTPGAVGYLYDQPLGSLSRVNKLDVY